MAFGRRDPLQRMREDLPLMPGRYLGSRTQQGRGAGLQRRGQLAQDCPARESRELFQELQVPRRYVGAGRYLLPGELQLCSPLSDPPAQITGVGRGWPRLCVLGHRPFMPM